MLNVSAEPAGKGGNYKTRVNSPVRHVRMGSEMLRGQRWALPFTCIYTLQYRCPFITLGLRRSLGACWVELKNLYEFRCWRESTMYWKKYVWTTSVTAQGESLSKIPMDFPTSRFSLLVVIVVSSRCKQTCPLQAAVLKEEVATYHQTSRLFFNILCWKTPPPPSHQQNCSPGSSQSHFEHLQTMLLKPPAQMRPFLGKPPPDGLQPLEGSWAEIWMLAWGYQKCCEDFV